MTDFLSYLAKVGSDAHDRGRVYQKTGDWGFADGVGALMKRPDDHNSADKLALATLPEILDLDKLLDR